MGKTKSIGLEIKIVSNLIKRNIDDIGTNEEKAKMAQITGVQSWIIGYIFEHGATKDIFQKDIEREFHIRRSTATGILQLMEKKGLIVRETVAYDARLKKLILTPEAREIHYLVTNNIQKIENKLKAGLSEGEIIFFFEIMEKIKRNMEK